MVGFLMLARMARLKNLTPHLLPHYARERRDVNDEMNRDLKKVLLVVSLLEVIDGRRIMRRSLMKSTSLPRTIAIIDKIIRCTLYEVRSKDDGRSEAYIIPMAMMNDVYQL